MGWLPYDHVCYESEVPDDHVNKSEFETEAALPEDRINGSKITGAALPDDHVDKSKLEIDWLEVEKPTERKQMQGHETIFFCMAISVV
jgi:hypothetical protein